MIKAVELFAGIGSFRRACDNLGLKTIWVNEIEPKATAVYRHNFGDLELTEANIVHSLFVYIDWKFFNH